MRNLNTIIEEYQKGDFEKRLFLFLECPSLRNEFVEIDQRGTEAVISCKPHMTPA